MTPAQAHKPAHGGYPGVVQSHGRWHQLLSDFMLHVENELRVLYSEGHGTRMMILP